MATNQQSPLEQVLAAAAPALAYQPDEYEQAEAKYYAEQEEKMRGLGKGKEAYIAPFPPRPQEQPVQQLPTIEVQATPTPTPLQQVLNPTPQGQPRTLTPCDLGMCDGLSYSRNGLDSNMVASSAPNGRFMVSNGNNLLAQLAGAAYLEKRGATVAQLETNNQRTELADLNDMRRTPQWAEQYNSLVDQGLDPRVAGAQADRLTGDLYGGQVGSIVSRYADPVNQARIQALGDQQVARLTSLGAFDQIGSANPSVAGGYQATVPTSISQTEDGNYVATSNLGGNEITSAPISGNRLAGVITGATSPNANTANTWSIANAQATADNAIANSANQQAYNQAQLEQRAIQQQAQMENNALRNQISAYNALSKEATASSGGSGKDGGNPIPSDYRKANAKAPAPIVPDESIATIERYGLNPDGSYRSNALQAMSSNPRATLGAQAYNEAIRINPADGQIWTNPQDTMKALQQLQLGIEHARQLRTHFESTDFKGATNSTSIRTAYDAYGRNLDRMLQLQNNLRLRYEKQRAPQPLGSAGIQLGQ